jgi:hypothetical protein
VRFHIGVFLALAGGLAFGLVSQPVTSSSDESASLGNATVTVDGVTVPSSDVQVQKHGENVTIHVHTTAGVVHSDVLIKYVCPTSNPSPLIRVPNDSPNPVHTVPSIEMPSVPSAMPTTPQSVVTLKPETNR